MVFEDIAVSVHMNYGLQWLRNRSLRNVLYRSNILCYVAFSGVGFNVPYPYSRAYRLVPTF